MSNHAELFNGLLEAGKALEELPQVKKEHASVIKDRDAIANDRDEQLFTIMERDEEIAQLKADLARREAELASATFRESEASAKINNLRAILGTSEPVPVVATEPMSEPHVCAKTGGLCEAIAEPVGQPQAADSQSDSTTLAEDRADAWTYKPFAEPETVNDVGPGSAWQLEAEANGRAGASSVPLSGPDSQATTYGVVEEGQFISHDPQEPKSVLEIAQDSFKAAMEPQPKPYADRPHWQKPGTLSWHDWIKGGGEKPYWWTNEDTLREAF